MRRFLIQSAEATWAEGVEFSCGLCAVRPLAPVYRAQALSVDHASSFPSLEHVEACYSEISGGLTTLTLLDQEPNQ